MSALGLLRKLPQGVGGQLPLSTGMPPLLVRDAEQIASSVAVMLAS